MNAIGGKVEPEEYPHSAMVREFEEETGVLHDSWNHFLTLRGEDYTVYFYRTFSDKVFKVRTMEEEEIYLLDCRDLLELSYDEPMILNLHYIIPMAMNMPLTDYAEVNEQVILRKEENMEGLESSLIDVVQEEFDTSATSTKSVLGKLLTTQDVEDLKQKINNLRKTLGACKGQFSYYVDCHIEKGTADSLLKASTNLSMVEKINESLEKNYV